MMEFKLHRIGLSNVSAYLLHRPGEAVLVDCGNAGSETRILKDLDRLGLAPSMLRLLVLTHAHFDHAGSAARLKELCGCQVMIHRSEASRLRQGYAPLPDGTRWKAKAIVGIGRTVARRLGRFPSVEPDLIVDSESDLHGLGFPARVIHTPGHTPGSMVVLTDDGTLIAGDSLFGLSGKQHFPPFAEDLPALLESWKRIRQLGARTLYPAHGGAIPRESFLAEFDDAMERYAPPHQ